jgi:dihydrofolate reductase
MGHPIVMGRRTFESIGRILPGRTTVVISRNRRYLAPGAIVVHSLDEALARTRGNREVFVVGGEQVYRAALARAERIYLTQVEADYEGDTRFPELPPSEWREVSREPHGGSAVSPGFSFVVLERTRGATPRPGDSGAAR